MAASFIWSFSSSPKARDEYGALFKGLYYLPHPKPLNRYNCCLTRHSYILLL